MVTKTATISYWWRFIMVTKTSTISCRWRFIMVTEMVIGTKELVTRTSCVWWCRADATRHPSWVTNRHTIANRIKVVESSIVDIRRIMIVWRLNCHKRYRGGEILRESLLRHAVASEWKRILAWVFAGPMLRNPTNSQIWQLLSLVCHSCQN